MVNIEIDGKKISARNGEMLIEAADAAGIPVPRFCYHKKLSIAANCRMCLVEVEKAAKPLPACATPVTEGMKVYTRSPKAIAAQKGVMEFLLINHPLDCPICDQGGECELQDVALTYGKDVSRFTEKKRVIKDKDIGPLISTEMTRCIHCTRCVRFGQEIAGMAELGATGRGEHMEIGTYVERAVLSELSGNVIDLCPVGALTSRPFRFTARAWELAQRDTIAPHDCIGSNLHVHTKGNRVMRVVPRENEEINETWISDRDRFSYEAVNSADRLRAPMIKREGVWEETDWSTALEFAVNGLSRIASAGGDALGCLVSPSATTEEMYLAQKLMRGLGSANIDHRLRQLDFSDQDIAPRYPALGQSLADLERLDAVLLIGSNIRKDQPIAAHRLRKAALNGTAVMFLNPMDYRVEFPVAHKLVTSPAAMVRELAGVAKALLQRAGTTPARPGLEALLNGVTLSERHQTIAEVLYTKDRTSLILGNYAQAHPEFAAIRALAGVIAEASASRIGYLSDGANMTGAWMAGAVPHRTAGGAVAPKAGLNAAAMLRSPRRGYLLLGVEPELDSVHGAAALRSLSAAEFVVALTSFTSPSLQSYAQVLLPVAPFAETSGTYVNCEGRWQSFNGVVAPLAETRPAWKVLRVLGNLFEIDGFDYVTSEEVRDELKELVGEGAVNTLAPWRCPPALAAAGKGLVRIAETPIYAVDALVRRAAALQKTVDAVTAGVYLNAAAAAHLQLTEGGRAQVGQGEAQVEFSVIIDPRVPDGCAYIPAGVPGTEMLSGDLLPLEVKRA